MNMIMMFDGKPLVFREREREREKKSSRTARITFKENGGKVKSWRKNPAMNKRRT